MRILYILLPAALIVSIGSGACTPDFPTAYAPISLRTAPPPQRLRELAPDITHYRLNWHAAPGKIAEQRIPSLTAALPRITVPLYAPIVITLTPISRTSTPYAPAGAYVIHNGRTNTITLQWDGQCTYAALLELSVTLADFARFNGKRLLAEITARSGNAPCLIDSPAILKRIHSRKMRADAIKPLPRLSRQIPLPRGRWLANEYSIPPLISPAGPAQPVEVTLPVGTYRLFSPEHGLQAALAITDTGHTLVTGTWE